jgi:hypothetical protein
MFQTIYKILSIIFVSKLIPYAGKIIWDRQCGFRRNEQRSDILTSSDTGEKIGI